MERRSPSSFTRTAIIHGVVHWAICPPGSLHDRMVKDWEFVRSYTIKDGHLFLALMADGGIYEFEPTGGSKAAAPKSRVAHRVSSSTSARELEGGNDTIAATFYKTMPAIALVERANYTSGPSAGQRGGTRVRISCSGMRAAKHW